MPIKSWHTHKCEQMGLAGDCSREGGASVLALFIVGAVLVTLQCPWWLKALIWLLAAGLQWYGNATRGSVRRHKAQASIAINERDRGNIALVMPLLAVALFAVRYCHATPISLQKPLLDQGNVPLIGFAQEVGANGLTLYTKDRVAKPRDDAYKGIGAAGDWLKVKLAVYNSDPSWEGQWLIIKSWRLMPMDQINQGSFNMTGFALGRGYDGAVKASASAVSILEDPEKPPYKLPPGLWLRTALRSAVELRLEPLGSNGQRWLSTLLFGTLEVNQAQTVKALGVLHLCVVSGCHYTLLLGALHQLLTGRLGTRLGTMIADALASLALLAVAASGFGSDRAYAKAQFSALSFILRRRLGGHRGLLALLCAWLLLWPTAIHQVGFQITFVASAALLLWRQLRQIGHMARVDRAGETAWIGQGWAMPQLLESALESALVALFILPILLLHFPEQPVLQVLATVLLTPLVSGIMLLGAVYIALGIGPVGGALAWLLESLCSGLEQLMLWMAASPADTTLKESLSTFTVPYHWAWLWCAVALLLLLAACWPKGLWPLLPRRCLGALSERRDWLKPMIPLGVMTMLLGLLLLSRVDYGLSVRTYALKDGEAYLIRAPGAVVLYDVGNDPALITLLRRAGVTHIDLLVISHPHQDHNGLQEPIQRAFKVSRVVAGTADEILQLGALDLRLASPGLADNPNETSILLAAKYRGQHVLLTGDLETKGIRWMLSQPWLEMSPSLYKASHHGSYIADYPKLLSALKPEMVWISGGRGKRVNKAPLKRELHRQGMPFYDTMEHGELYWSVAPESLIEVVQRVIQGFLRGHTKRSA